MREFGVQENGVTYVETEGAYGVCIRGTSVLIELADRGYCLPGGGIEGTEAPEEALGREFLEETGYEITSKRSLGSALEYFYLADQDLYKKKIGHFYLVELGAKGNPTHADGTMAPVEWVDLTEAPSKMYLESQRWAIQEALRQLA